MNWKKEIERIDLDFMEVDNSSMEAHYKIGKVYFIVQIEWWKSNYDFETARYDIDINVKSGVWWTDEITDDKVMEFDPSYKEWMFVFRNPSKFWRRDAKISESALCKLYLKKGFCK